MTKFKTQDVLAVAYAAYRKNKGYVKDTFRFSEPTNETAFSNKDYVKYQMVPEHRPQDFKPLVITEEDYKGVEDALMQGYSGHEKPKSLEVYSKLSFQDCQKVYENKIKDFPI